MTASPYTRLREHWDRHGAFSGLAWTPRLTPEARTMAWRLRGSGAWYATAAGCVFARSARQAHAYAREVLS
jgi:hypothetical protein